MQLVRRKFIANIALPENKSGLTLLSSSDPRDQESKPDAYVGVVEQVSNDCEIVKVGDKVVFQRFDYGTQSADIGPNRVIVDERKDLLIAGEDRAAPGIVAVNVLEKESALAIPEWVKMNNLSGTLFGRVVASGWECTEGCGTFCTKEHVQPDDIIFFRRLPDQQFCLGDYLVIFDNRCRHCHDHVRMDCAADIILAKMEEMVIPKMLKVI